MRFSLPGACLTAMALSVSVAAAQPLEEAGRLYQRTEYRTALSILKQQPRTAAALFLEGRCWYHLGDFKQSVEALEKAVMGEPRNSLYVNWLGRAWGRRAEKANVFLAPGYAVKARDAFERAVQLNGRNLEALNDLFQYYIEAPGIMGGGVDKAKGLLAKIKAVDEADFHSALAQLAGKRKDHATEETELRLAANAAPDRLGKTADLARFLARRGRNGESDAVLDEALRRWPEDRGLIFTQAELWIQGRRNQQGARKILSRYLTLPLTPDDPSRDEARKLLNKIGG